MKPSGTIRLYRIVFSFIALPVAYLVFLAVAEVVQAWIQPSLEPRSALVRHLAASILMLTWLLWLKRRSGSWKRLLGS
jgi:hypothetical protein